MRARPYWTMLSLRSTVDSRQETVNGQPSTGGLGSANVSATDALHPIDRADLGDAVAARLREQILNGALAPGSRLVETALAEAFGTSRGPIRDAIARLAGTGLVTVNPRRGAYVTTLSAHDIEEVYSLRIALETHAARLAARRGTTDDWSAMARALVELERAAASADADGAAVADMGFHRAIVQAAQQGRLVTAWESFADQTMLLLRELSHLGSPVQDTSGGHGAVLAALEAGDGALAATAVFDHLSEARATMLDRMGTSPPRHEPGAA